MLHRTIEAALTDNLLVVAMLALALFLNVIAHALLGVDSWLTLAAGREVADNGLPHHEVLTTIPAGRTWTDQQWLAQLAFYGLDRVGGLGLAVLVHTLLVTAAVAACAVTARLRGASSRMTLAAAVVCLVVAPWSWQLRAQSVALPLFALTLALVSMDPRLAARRTLLVFPVLVLWANVHGSVTLGALIVSLAAGLTLATRARGTLPASPVWRPTLYLVAPWACLLASPYGTELVDYYRLLLLDSPVRAYVTEWQAPRPHGYFLVFFAVAAMTVVIAIWQRRRFRAFDLAVLAITLAGALWSVRAVVWFSLALAMLMPLALDGIVPSGTDRPVHRRLAAALMGLTAAAVVAASVFTLARGDASLERSWSREGAAAAVRALDAAGEGAALWSSGTYADWLLWKEPTLRGRVAWDARFELLTRPELRRIVLFNSHEPGWMAPALGYPVLVLDRHDHADQLRDLRRRPGTVVEYADASVAVLSRPPG